MSCAVSAESPIDYNARIRPLLSSHCFPCHGSDEGARKAKLRLDLAAEATRERDGIWPIKPGAPGESEVVSRITATDPADVMPPRKAGVGLSREEIKLVRQWIAEGAPYAEHWAWKSPRRPVVPSVRGSAWPRNEIDHFILARLQERDLKPSAEADPYTLARRLALDLDGLPSTHEQAELLAGSSDPAAYGRLVDQLLASPQFGERWARIWLDLARYADSAGYGSDPLRPNMWPWRDWLIEALNRNLPYDQFTIEQIAGDLLPNATEEQIVATGFHRNTMTNTEGGTDDEEFRVAAVKDRANTTAQVWMGLTLGCAQCHTHKFDPITQREYYQFYAFFNQTEDSDQPDDRPTLPLPTETEKLHMQEWQDRIADLEERRARNTDALDRDLDAWEKRQECGVDWRRLRPVRLRSLRGAELKLLEDDSVMTPDDASADTYLISVPIPFTNATAIRLELLEDAQKPGGGLELDASNSARLTELRVILRSPRAELPRARYVRIELPGPRRVLSLAEVQVFGGGNNLAVSGVSSQSSTDGPASADRAIDGNTDGDFASCSASQTRPEDLPWWEIDLVTNQPIEAIAVWNRTDNGLGTRMADFKVSALDAERGVVWSKCLGSAPNPVAFLSLAVETNLVLQNASTRFVQPDHPVQQAIDGDMSAENGWIRSTNRSDETAVFEFQDPPLREPGSVATLFLTRNGRGSLGRIRFSITAEPPPVRELPERIREILALDGGTRSPVQVDRLRDYIRDFAPSMAEFDRQLSEARAGLAAINPVSLPIMRELPSDKRRVTRLMHKGSFQDLGDPVEPAVPAAFHPWPTGATRDRLGLAHWLVNRDNPLSARVEVNRLWARLFGVGLVETEEDFGTQGSLPSHPELLDWLAVEFMDRGWDVKAMIRMMVMSATYRQSSVRAPALSVKDPRNVWLSRAPRLRLEAEMVRDQALALAGLLSPKIGGPSVFPPQPDGLWRAAFNGERDYPTSIGEDRYRRGLYVFLRRTIPNPTLSTFDAPSREACTFRRLPTNTPLQAFVTLNDPVYVEAAQGLAHRILRESGPDPRHRIQYALRLCLGRPSTEAQEEIVASHFERELAHYSLNEEDARRLAASPPEGETTVAEMAAWTSVANVLLNLDALLNRG